MGGQSSKLEKALSTDGFSESLRLFGFENFGNTCYCNSVLQTLFFCRPFRTKLLAWYSAQQTNPPDPDIENSLIFRLGELFHSIVTQKKRAGVFSPRKFIQTLKQENEIFRGLQQQDAHEFLNFLLNNMIDKLKSIHKARSNNALTNNNTNNSNNNRNSSSNNNRKQTSNSGNDAANDRRKQKSETEEIEENAENNNNNNNNNSNNNNSIDLALVTGVNAEGKTWIEEIFEGTISSDTRCLCCETVSSRDESFLDLSLEIAENTSVSACLRNFSGSEMLAGRDKFFCDTCATYQEAQKSMRVKKLPRTLALHLKRFKYIEHLQRFKKLSYRVVFPRELRLFNVVPDIENNPRYELFGVVAHLGGAMTQGHYMSAVSAEKRWFLFDDDLVELIEESDIESFFGLSVDGEPTNTSGYILFYEAVADE